MVGLVEQVDVGLDEQQSMRFQVSRTHLGLKKSAQCCQSTWSFRLGKGG